MKLLLIVDDYLPHSTKVASKMMHDLAIQLYKNGHSISVLTPLYSIKKNIKIEVIDKINVIYFKNGKINNIYKFNII